MSNLPNPYFGADPKATSFKCVYKLSASNFTEFFNSQLNTPIVLTKTKDEYEALPEAERKSTKYVRFYTPAAFKTNNDGDRSRSDKTLNMCKSISLVCLDVDDHADASQILGNLEACYEMLGDVNFAIHTTISHGAGHAKVRVVVDADDLPVDNYHQAVSWLAGKLGLSSVTSESCVPSQAMFRPVMFSDMNKETEHPVKAHRLNGRALELSDIVGVDEMPTTSGKRVSRRGKASDDSDGLAFLTPKLDMVTLKDVEDALEHTDPDLDMLSWIKVGMGIKHQFSDQEDEAFQIFNAWSAKGEKYTSEDDTLRRWSYFTPNTNDKMPVTIRTTLSIAQEFGWDNDDIQQKYINAIESWMNRCESFPTLINQGIDKIATCPMLTPILHESLLNHLSSTAKRNFKNTVPVPTLRKQLKARFSAIRSAELEKTEKNKQTPPWARGLCYVSETKKLLRIATGERMDRDSFDSVYARQLLPTKEQLAESGEADNPRAKNTPIMRPQDFVLNDLKIPTVYRDIYDPTNPDDAVVKQDGVWYVNTYRKSYPEPSRCAEDIAEAGKLIKAHMALLAEEPELQSLLLYFTAFMVQNPGVKIRWAPLCQGAEGNGKGIWAKINRIALGSSNVKSVDPEKIFSSYNDWAHGAQLAILNEIHSKGKSRYEIENKLKEPIADNEVSINQKYQDHREVKNVTNYILFTNFPDALAISSESRRYLVVKSWMQRKSQVSEVRESGHYDRMDKLLKNKTKAIRAFLEQVVIPEDFPVDEPPPVTKYQLEMNRATMPEAEMLFETILEDGEHPLIQRDLISSTTLINVLNSHLVQRTNTRYVTNMLLQQGYKAGRRFKIDGEQHTVFVPHDSFLKPCEVEEIAIYRDSEAEDIMDMLA